jgi:hypothetical protein
VSVVRFFSTRLNTLPASPAGGPPAVVASSTAAAGPASSQGRRLVLNNFAGHTSPTSVHNRYISVIYSRIQKKMIYIKRNKN